ncbi:MAG: aminotransferase, class [Pedosphaera sp.]|nr:aminotransferase, class [Pedosphaera sp.]
MIYRRNFLRGLFALGLLPAVKVTSLDSSSTVVTDSEKIPGWPDADDKHYWEKIRRQFSIPSDEVYFNTGTLGASPRQVTAAMIAETLNLEKTIAHYDYKPEHPEYIAGYRPQAELRRKAGTVINASEHEVALVQNATMASNLIANGLELKPGDEVLITDQEHPGARGPWELRAKRQGIIVRQLPIPIPTPDPESVIKIVADAITPRTRVIAVPHVTSKYCIVLPVREICELARKHDIFTLVDGAQAAGQLRVDVKQIGCDAYATSPHKWLFAPPGNGLLYVREEKLKDIWATLASAQWNNYAPADGIFRLMQFGTANFALLTGLNAALDFHLRIGSERIEKRIIGLADQLRVGLQKIKGATIHSPTHPALAGAMVNYGITGVTGPQLQEALWTRQKIRVRAQGQEGVRQSVHVYNSPREIDATLAVVQALAANPPKPA